MQLEPVNLCLIWLALAIGLRFLMPSKLTAVLLAVVVVCSSVFMFREYSSTLYDSWQAGQANVLLWTRGEPSPPLPTQPGPSFPDLNLVDNQGISHRLSEFEDKVVILQTVNMSCPACIALAGGKSHGAFYGLPAQPNLAAFPSYLRQFGGVTLDPSRVVWVQLLVFDPQSRPPTPEDVKAWNRHFQLRHEDGVFVFAATRGLHAVTEPERVPGFYLIDRERHLRAVSTRDGDVDLYTDFIPRCRQLLDGSFR